MKIKAISTFKSDRYRRFCASPKPTFLEGMARTLDIGNTIQHPLYEEIIGEFADYLALKSDFSSIS